MRFKGAVLELRGVQLKAMATSSDCSFDCVFEAGRICVVLGTNLAGKTDLCRLIAGLPTQASCDAMCLDGIDLARQPTRRRPVALVYQAFVNYPNWTVAANIGSPMRARKESTSQIGKQVGELAEALGLDDLLDRFPHELSGGQQQRVALARALAKQARVLLLDEPLVNLDYKLREALQGELKALLSDRATVVIYTTSEPREAFALGDDALLLRDGKLLQSGPPLAVYQAPSSLDAMALMSDPRVNRAPSGTGVVAVRPEHVSLEPVDDAVSYELRVIATETNGSESFVHGSCEGNTWVVRQPGIVDFAVGERVGVYVRPQDLLEFPA